jgi:CpcD/allophycocyanin linker domain
MAGMMMSDRSVRLEVAGVCQQSMARLSNYTVTVPYASMSTTMRNIHRIGGKIVGVHVSDVKAAAATPVTTSDAADKTPTKKGKKK